MTTHIRAVTLPPALIATLMAAYYLGVDGLSIKHLASLHRQGLLDVSYNCLSATVTGLGEAHIRQLCALPLPEEQVVYVSHKGDKV